MNPNASTLVRITDEELPELHIDLNSARTRILSAEVRGTATKDDDGDDPFYHTPCYFFERSVPATRENAIKLLALCKYEADKECVILRTGLTDPEDADFVEHEDFIERVKTYVTDMGITDESEAANE